LLKLMDHCSTPFGKRLFKRWLAMPLKRIHDIEERQNAVEDFNGSDDHSTTLKDAVSSNLKGATPTAFITNSVEFSGLNPISRAGLPDLERIVSRIHAGSAPILTFLSALDAFDLLWVRAHSCIRPDSLRGSRSTAHLPVACWQDMITALQPVLGQLRSKRLAFLLTVGKGFPNIAPYLEYFSRAFDRDQAKSEQVGAPLYYF
jgi:hypothetical protein